MEQRGQELRQAIERSRGNGLRWRCPASLRSEVVAYVNERRDRGAALAEITAELGVSDSSLQRWFTAERVGGVQPASLREVRVAEPTSTAKGLTVVTPRGYRVEGLDVEGALRLLQAL